MNEITRAVDTLTSTYWEASALVGVGRYNDALKLLEVLIHGPLRDRAGLMMGLALTAKGELESATSHYARMYDAGVAKECYEDLISDWATSLLQAGQRQKALDVVTIDGKRTPGRSHQAGILNLGLGNWPLGWHEYESRFHDGSLERPALGVRYGSSLADLRKFRHVVVVAEQGLGDCLQFVRYVWMLKELVSHVTVLTPSPLYALFQKYLAIDCDIAMMGEQRVFGDIAVSMMSLPRMFETTTVDIPDWSSIEGVEPLADPLLAGYAGKKIGLCWAGQNRDADGIRAKLSNQRRNIPVRALDPLLGESGVRCQFVSLQRPDNLVDDSRIHQPIRRDWSMLDTARLVQDLDLVISVDTSVAHLAGALGKPVWLLSRFDQCWRWFWDGRDTSPWYPSMKIFQQVAPGDWSGVAERVVSELVRRL